MGRRSLRPEDLQPPLRLDAEVGLDEINFESLAELDKLKPAGQGNPYVQFYSRNLTHAKPLQKIGAQKQHVKMWVTQANSGFRIPNSEIVEAVWWNGGDKSLPVGKFDLAFAPSVNEFNGRRAVQLKVLDWRAA
jgi:single-stranded-DNA-specific exonuclease